MLVTLIGKNEIYKIVLPKTPIGNYWISDNTNNKKINLINIEGKNGNWQIITNKEVKAINPRALVIENDNIKITPETEVITERIILKEYNLYGVCIGSIENFYIVYCSPTYESNFSQLRIRNTKEIFIGKSEKNHIVYNNKLVSNIHARIIFDDNTWVLENFDKKFGTYVNNKIVTNETKKLENGDVIFIMGLKIIILGNSIYINNPLSSMTYNKKYLVAIDNENQRRVSETKTETIKEDEIINIYSDDDYFSRSPRLINVIEKEKVKIDPPPAIDNGESMPLFLVLGSSISMGIVMILSMTRTVGNNSDGNGLNKELISQIIIIIAMLVSILLIPLLNTKYEKRQRKKKEEKRQYRYRKYIDSKIEIIDGIMDKQRRIIYQNNLSQDECVSTILNKDTRLWERKKEDVDFLNVRLGIGDIPLEIDINYPEDKFMMDDDKLVEVLNTILLKSKIIKSAPICFSLFDKKNYAFISKDKEELNLYMKSIILQLITLQSYEDLKLVFLVGEDKNKKWDYVKLLPHIWSSKKDIRFFADNYNDMEIISSYLENIFNQRLGKLKDEKEKEKKHKSFSQYYLIITDDYKKIDSLKIINRILQEEQNLGFGMIFLTSDLTQLPNEVQTFIELNNKEGKIYESEITSKTQKKFIYNIYDNIPFDKISRQLFNIPIRYVNNSNTSLNLPTSYSFLEMYDVGLIEQLNILERWKKNDSTLSLKAPIGVDGTNKLIYLDIHEKSHGPHGLIAGSTGSGKSESIITYILSLAVNYHPDDIAFILIDYKGGGLAGAFKKREIVLPHLVGTITNIDTAGLQRSLVSIQSELRRRQIIFNDVRNMTEEGTIDIYKYQKLYHDGFVKKPIPHLLIICDEFAELKQQQPDFMDELISVSRIGRSLGVHLILATQKPAGIVNDQIRSNSRFEICLKVQNKEDSNDVIGQPDAANLKRTRTILYKSWK